MARASSSSTAPVPVFQGEEVALVTEHSLGRRKEVRSWCENESEEEPGTSRGSSTGQMRCRRALLHRSGRTTQVKDEQQPRRSLG